ncbi:hypothetical protein BC8716_03510 [Shouchella clausii]|nr:hypothetical protein BC8716_03510 [Shouchella clausii]PAF13550.1 hypothetical protein CHH59_12990 [Shouchella clausii]PTL24150.1 hypothetical protein DA802_04080 [Shouchella clausii]QNM41450.1 hypothetical protein DUT88_00335 [Shouchella clausii]
MRSVFLITKFNQTKCLRDGLAESEEANRTNIYAQLLSLIAFSTVRMPIMLNQKRFSFWQKKSRIEIR